MNDDYIRPAPGRLQGTAPPARPPYARSHRRRGGALAVLLLAVGLSLLLVGCVGDATRRLEAEGFASWLAGVEGADAAVAELLANKELAEMNDLSHVVELDLREVAEVVNGWDAAGAPTTRTVVDLDAVLKTDADGALVSGALLDYRRGIEDIAAARVKFFEGYDKPLFDVEGKPLLNPDGTRAVKHFVGWLESRKNFADAISLRGELRRTLERQGIEPEDAEAFATGLADYLSKKGK